MALEVFWNKRASKKFDSILDYLVEEWGEQTTTLFVKKVYEFIDLLSEFPEIGSIEKKDLNIRGFVVVKQITVFYQVREDKIVLLNFYDNRQKPRKPKY